MLKHIVRVGALGLGVFEHPVAGRLGNAQDPALRRYRAAAGVGPYHACFRANTGAACSETSTSISSCLSRFRNSISSFSSGVRLSAAFVEPLLRIPCTQRRSVCLCSISCCGFSHDDFSGLGRACRPRNGLNWMVLVSPPERTGKDYDQHAPRVVCQMLVSGPGDEKGSSPRIG